MYDSRADLVTRLTNIRSAIDKARTAISYGTAVGDTLTRPRLKELLEEEQYILSRIEQYDAQTTGGFINRVEFNKPT